MSKYLLINILIIIVPLILSFEKNIKYYKNFLPLFLSIIIVSTVFIIWDAIAASRGDWGFNEKYILGIEFFGLPLEEILFFITVPYSTIFIYETLKFYLNEKHYNFSKYFFFIPVVVFIIAAIIFSNQYYTFTVLIFCAFFLLAAIIFNESLLRSNIFWLYVLITYVPFLLVNYFLTALPVVWYNPNAFSGNRFLTIPFEDFFYSFSLLSFYLFFYLIFKKWLNEKKSL